MSSVLAAIIVCTAPVTANNVWNDDYAHALEAAMQQNKPLVVCFADSQTDAISPTHIAHAGPLAERFVALNVDRNTESGKRLFALFDVAGANAWVVIDRTGQWQFSRYDRKLSRSEVGTLLRATQNAKGTPDVSDYIRTELVKYEVREPVRMSSSNWSSCYS